MRTIAALSLLACAAAYAQTATPVFEVASVKPSPPPEPGKGFTMGERGGPGSKDPGRWTAYNYSLQNIVLMAYDLRFYQLVCPDWMRTERFDIVAKVPEGATKDDLKLMLQNLLTERFKLTYHHEKKEVPAYELVVAKGGPKMKEAVDQPPPADATDRPAGPPAAPAPLKLASDGYPSLTGTGNRMANMNGRARWINDKATMDVLAGMLSGQLSRPVTNATGLTGKYDLSLHWSSDSGTRSAVPPPGEGGATIAVADDSGPTIFSAIQEQFGLRLESKKGTIEILVVDKIEKTPSEN